MDGCPVLLRGEPPANADTIKLTIWQGYHKRILLAGPGTSPDYNIKTLQKQQKGVRHIMQYESTEVKPSNGLALQKNIMVKAASRLSTSRLLWIIIVRHKFAIVSIIAVLLAIDSIFPPFWDIVKSLVS